MHKVSPMPRGCMGAERKIGFGSFQPGIGGEKGNR